MKYGELDSLSTRDLSAICDCACYQFKPLNLSEPNGIDEYGSPKGRIIRNNALYKAGRRELKARYNDWNLSKEERYEAGESLKYSIFRIALHEKFYSKVKSFRKQVN